jgi:hypothetical protein
MMKKFMVDATVSIELCGTLWNFVVGKEGKRQDARFFYRR